MPTSSWLVSGPRRGLACASLMTVLVLVSSTTVFAKVKYRPEAESLFASCQPNADSSVSREYLCPGLTASIAWVQLPDEETDAQRLERFRNGMASLVSGKMESKPVKLTLGGVERDALELSIQPLERGSVATTGHVATMRQEGGGWLLSCLADPKRRIAVKHCAKILEFFAVHGVPEPVDLKNPSQPAKPLLGTQELVVPEGCSYTGLPEVGRIQCASSFLAWLVVANPSNVKKFREDQWASLRELAQEKATSNASVMTESDVECRVMGAQDKCHQFRVPIDGGHFRTLVGLKRQGTQTLQVICMQMDYEKALPAVCNGLMEFLPTVAPASGSGGKSPAAAPK
ncbi:hypothetical protein [Myxococcus landrumensis]|uniref:Lipoprotein n=1 Tax=Myxococcus landrumensis TaxID=2813577 RepID=A0ABX7N9V7_9BACT|nr:hypothetical protein [Myxococcus landrumus]QSQ15261.1 hypothetical protein JY572_04015 [Myxococcus landrumus]